MFLNWIKKIKIFVDIKTDTDKLSSIEQIKKDVYLRGANIFYLMCSAILASVGLDIDSPAVIIGAMLISPLMSPILGVGLSLGIHDKESFFISLREFIFSVLLSLLVSIIYFSITPLGHPTSEILARIKPTALDILIAFFGGVAGIVAITRSKIANALPGVAIATALMPPICTAGYGLATARFEFFFGAFYLFFINAVFISFSSYIIVRYLRFPFKEYMERKKLIHTRIIIYVFIFLVAVPSFIIFYGVIDDARLDRNLNKFVREQIQTENLKVIDWNITVGKNKVKVLNVFIIGNKIPQKKLDSISSLLPNYGVENTRLDISLLSDERGLEGVKDELKTDLTSVLKVMQKSDEIKDSIIRRDISKNDSIIFANISNELKIFYPEINEIGFSNNFLNKSTVNDSSPLNKISVITIKWNKKQKNSDLYTAKNKIYKFLTEKLNTDTLSIIYLQ